MWSLLYILLEVLENLWTNKQYPTLAVIYFGIVYGTTSGECLLLTLSNWIFQIPKKGLQTLSSIFYCIRNATKLENVSYIRGYCTSNLSQNFLKINIDAEILHINFGEVCVVVFVNPIKTVSKMYFVQRDKQAFICIQKRTDLG